MLNAFRLTGDMAHVASIVVLLYQLCVKGAHGVSLKTQELYLIVFMTRYLDLFLVFYSFYNSIMKILYICTTLYIIYSLRISTTYDKELDTFQHWTCAVVPCVIIGVATTLMQGLPQAFIFVEVSFHHTPHTTHAQNTTQH